MEFANDWPLWIIEDVTWPVMWGLLIAGILAFVWFVSRNTVALLTALFVGATIVFCVIVETKVVTEKEYLIDSVYQMADSVANNDADGIVQFVRPENEVFRQRIINNMKMYDFRSCRLLGFNQTDIVDEPTQKAEIGFAVFATGSLAGRIETIQSANVVVKLEFQKTNGKWYIEGYGYRPSNVQQSIQMIRQ